MSDDLVLICMRVADLTHPIEGATQRTCSQCGDPIWLAPSSLAVVERARLLCRVCARANPALAEGAFGGFLPGQWDEVKREVTRELGRRN